MKKLSVKSKLIFAFLLSTFMLLITCFLAFSVQRQATELLHFTFEESVPKIITAQELLNSIYQYSLKIEQALKETKLDDFKRIKENALNYYSNIRKKFSDFSILRMNNQNNDIIQKLDQVFNNTNTQLELKLTQLENKTTLDQKWNNSIALVQELFAYVKTLELNITSNLDLSSLSVEKQFEEKLTINKVFETLIMKSLILNEVLQEMQGVSDTTSVFNYRNKFSLNFKMILRELDNLKKNSNYHEFLKTKDILDIYDKSDNVFKLKVRFIEVSKTLITLNESSNVYTSELYQLIDKYVKSLKDSLGQRKIQIYDFSNFSIYLIVFSGILFFITSIVVFHFIIQNDILRRLKNLSGVTLELAKGNHHVVIDSEGNDEITEMADSAIIFKENLVELETSKVKLENAYEELQQFAYRTSHDLKSPLVTIQGLTKIVHAEIEAQNNPIANDCIKRIENLSTQLSILIEDILNLAKSDLDNQIEEIIDIPNILIRSLEKTAGLSSHKIDISTKWKHSILICQPLRFTQVLDNLISNAYKYCDSNKKKPFIRIYTYEEDKNFFMEIEDNGLGIPKEQVNKLFKMFNRFHNTSFGSGLGLYLTKKNIEHMNGKIVYESRNNNTVFKIQLPLKKIELKK